VRQIRLQDAPEEDEVPGEGKAPETINVEKVSKVRNKKTIVRRDSLLDYDAKPSVMTLTGGSAANRKSK
jgi:hypothetical protein